jgi:tetraacyldisaccharide 4'-kinase
MSRLLAPLAIPYALALHAKNHAYDRAWVQTHKLAWPVVSVGNLSVGGAGKTPVVIALLALLKAQGMHPDVLSRGYGRVSPARVERVDPDGDARRFGDEPLLMTRATGAPVYVGASRYAAGLLAERQAPAQQNGVHLLDDGFQHRQLARAVNLVVMHPSDTAGRLLPEGRLREPLAALHRADALLLRDDDQITEPALIRAGIRKPIYRLLRELTLPSIEGPVFAFCGIAHPDEFFAQLRAHGASLAGTMAFRDHHRFTHEDVESIAMQARGAAALLTTEKDLIRLSPESREQIAEAAPLLTVGLRVRFTDEDALAARLSSALGVGPAR